MELLIVLAVIGMLAAGVSRAYITGIDYERSIRQGREDSDVYRRFEDRISKLLQHSFLSPDPNDTVTYFIGGTGAGVTDTITFTVAGRRLSPALLNSQEDFESLNNEVGPQGGVAEISISPTAVGNAPNRDGLFMREQVPSDGDPSQGGYERVFAENVTDIEFEFFDGSQWQTTWDTQFQSQKRLPAAVRVTYRLDGDDDRRIFVVRLPLSDVTPLNPLTEESVQ
jgi:hypothetical protein